MSITGHHAVTAHTLTLLMAIISMMAVECQAAGVSMVLDSPVGDVQACAEDKTVYGFKIGCDQQAKNVMANKSMTLKFSFPVEYTSRSNLSQLKVEWNSISYPIQAYQTKYPIIQVTLPVGVIQLANSLKIYSQKTILTPYIAGNVTFSVFLSLQSMISFQANTSVTVSPAFLRASSSLESPFTSTNSCISMAITTSCQYFAADSFLTVSSTGSQMTSITSVFVNGKSHANFYVQERMIYIQGLDILSGVSPAAYEVKACSLVTQRTVSKDCSYAAAIGVFGPNRGVLSNTDVCVETKYPSNIGQVSIESPKRSVLSSSPLVIKLKNTQEIRNDDTLECILASESLIGRIAFMRQLLRNAQKHFNIHKRRHYAINNTGNNDTKPTAINHSIEHNCQYRIRYSNHSQVFHLAIVS